MDGLVRAWKHTINLSAVPQAIHNRTEFIAGPLMAVVDEYEGFYDVLSYGVRIARWSHDGWSVNTRKYSPTTSRHQRLVADGIALYRGCSDEICQRDYSHV